MLASDRLDLVAHFSSALYSAEGRLSVIRSLSVGIVITSFSPLDSNTCKLAQLSAKSDARFIALSYAIQAFQ
jgi:hypothetical protein